MYIITQITAALGNLAKISTSNFWHMGFTVKFRVLVVDFEISARFYNCSIAWQWTNQIA